MHQSPADDALGIPAVLQPELDQWWSEFGAAAELAQNKAEVDRVWAASPFIARSCLKNPALLTGLIDSGDLDCASTADEYRRRVRAALEPADTLEALMSRLRQLRSRELLRIAWRDLSGRAGLDTTLAALSGFAEACLDGTVGWCYQTATAKHGTPRDGVGEAQRLVVLGMGKLGGRELNFSSDIDLLFAYPEDGHTDGDASLANSQFFIRLGQQIIKVLSEITAEGFVFRVDMRLRPFGEVGALAAGFDAIEDYYQTHGRNWERYALIKARVVGGDAEQGDALLARLRPFIYRRYLDYGAFESLREMKGLISDEVRRQDKESNIKLGAGGIREVEFIGQAFQLIRGGRNPDLQIRAIQEVLALLEREDLLPAYAVKQLVAAYRFLRAVENRLQMAADQQTHRLPVDETARVRLAFSMGYGDWGAFAADLARHRQRVHEQFEQVFAAPQFAPREPSTKAESAALVQLWQGGLDNAEATEQLREAGFQTPGKAVDGLRRLREGQSYRTRSVTSRERMDRLMPLLIGAAGQSADPDRVLPRLLAIIAAVARRSVYIALLAENPLALSQLVKLSAASPWIADLLSRYPILLDELMDARSLYAPPDRAGLAHQLQNDLRHVDRADTEEQMDCLRAFKQMQTLRVAASDVMGALPLMKVSDQLTWIAEALLDQCLTATWAQLTVKYGGPRAEVDGVAVVPEFAVIGYGKLGGIELGYGSDLDLVFLHDGSGGQASTDGEKSIANEVFFARLAQRLIHMLSAFTAAGTLYEVDARLRPGGASGLLVSGLGAFEAYQIHNAWTWEHQALVRARVVAGGERIRRAFEVIRRTVLCQARAIPTLREEVRAMRTRMWRQFARRSSETFDLKKDPGSITDIEFMVQYLVLAHAHRHPPVAEYTDNIRILDNLAEGGILSPTDAQALQDVYRGYRDKVHALNLQDQDSVVNANEFKTERDYIQRQWDATFGPTQDAALRPMQG